MATRPLEDMFGGLQHRLEKRIKELEAQLAAETERCVRVMRDGVDQPESLTEKIAAAMREGR